jgi:hypothetical protein
MQPKEHKERHVFIKLQSKSPEQSSSDDEHPLGKTNQKWRHL